MDKTKLNLERLRAYDADGKKIRTRVLKTDSYFW